MIGGVVSSVGTQASDISSEEERSVTCISMRALFLLVATLTYGSVRRT